MSLALELNQAVLPSADAPFEGVARAVDAATIEPAKLYCLLIVLLPLLAIPACILLGKSDFFLHHGASVWVQANDAIFNMRDRNCEVLVFGDSTAMTGIDPDLVNQQTGFRTCNIAVTNAVLAVTGNLTLDSYLAHNTRPKMLIVQLSPDDFQAENRVWQHTIYAEGLLELLRHGQPDEKRTVLLSHPREALAFAGYAAGFSAYYAIKDVWFRATSLRPEEDQVHVRNGFFTPPAPARTHCDVASRLGDTRGEFSRTLANDYRTLYADRSATVMVDVAPIPSCDENLKAYAKELRGVTSNALQPLPIGLFNDGRHYTALGSRVVSSLISRQVNAAALDDPSLDTREPSGSLLALRRVSLPEVR